MAETALAVIPARGGSKRLPRKNIRTLAGKPLIVYTIEAALESGCFESVVVSTDDDDIAAVARAAGAEVPFVRPASLADDHTPASSVTIAALEQLDLNGEHYPLVAQLLPNCPLRDATDIRASLHAFQASSAYFQLSVTRYGWLDPHWALELGADGVIEPLFPEALKQRSQDLPTLYCPTGAVWWARSKLLRRAGTFYGPGVLGFPLAWQHAIDIDDESDFAMAEALVSLAAGGGKVTP